MIISDISNLSYGSAKKVDVECDVKISQECRNRWSTEYYSARKNIERNGKSICCKCSIEMRPTGIDHPRCKYKTMDHSFFDRVDTEDKGYLLGWIASDGSINKNNSIKIFVKESDELIIHKLKNIICPELPISQSTSDKSKQYRCVGLIIYSKKITQRVCELLGITPGKKFDSVNFPVGLNDTVSWAFLRGYFDGDGCVKNPTTDKKRTIKCVIASKSKNMLEAIQVFCNIPCSIKGDQIIWTGTNALDFLGKLYDKAKWFLERKRNLYLDWCHFVPSLSGRGNWGRESVLKWNKVAKEAHPPFKERVSDSGWDLTIIEKVKTVGDVEFYRTGLKITPDFGWYFMVVPRSSISKTGYMLANSVGIIDRGYVGEIFVPLRKVDKNAEDIQLPCRVVQIIPCPIVHFELKEVDSLDSSSRSEQGFGSTGE